MELRNLLKFKCILFYLLLLAASVQCAAQPSFRGLEHLFTSPEHYVIGYTPVQPSIDGDITDKMWQKATWTNFFKDIEGNAKPAPYYSTRVKMLWDKKYLYVAADIQDDHVWATLRKRDEVVFYDNDFEIFVNPGNTTHQYFELEFNALNTVFDLFLSKPYRTGGGALIGWNAPGLRSAVKIHGTLNNPNDKDKGWTLECAIPLSALSIGNDVTVPREGSLWRINFSRVEWNTSVKEGKYVKEKTSDGKVAPENNWVWSPQGVINMHYPERWGYLQFTMKQDPKEFPSFTLPYAEKQKQYLWLVYYHQQEFRGKYNRYATTLQELNITPVTFELDGAENTLEMEATSHCFYATISSLNKAGWSINNEGLIELKK